MANFCTKTPYIILRVLAVFASQMYAVALTVNFKTFSEKFLIDFKGYLSAMAFVLK